MQLLNLLRTTERALRARFHFWMGRFWLLTGRRARAEREFREVLSKVGEDFQASVYLGRLALESGDLPGALREMSAARRHSPARFARLRAEIWQRLPGPALERGDPATNAEPTGSCLPLPLGESTAAAERAALWATEGDRQGSQALPQFYYWQATPDSFDLEGTEILGASSGPVASGSGPAENGSEREDGRSNPNGDASGEPLGDGGTDSWFFGDGFFRDERTEDSPWTDFLSHHYFFDSLSEDPDAEELAEGEDDYDALGEDLFDFLSDEETEALSPWSDQVSPHELQGEEDQYLRSPLAGFYEELEEARKEAEGVETNSPVTDDSATGPGSRSDHQRFEGMPPIEPSDLGSVDWDDLLGRLKGDAADPS